MRATRKAKSRVVSVDSQDLPRPFGPFTLLRLIAQGGMGSVFLALRPLPPVEASRRELPTGLEEVCVVKTVRSDLKADREAVARFLDEARVVQKLHHPRIAKTIDAGVIDKTYFLGLEFISGRNLRDVQTRAQKQGKALPEELIVHVVADMLEALDHAHNLDDDQTKKPLHIVHRDVSPHNMMLAFDGSTKLIDFGLAAHELKRELTRPGVMVGKLRYNAPEQVRDRALDGRSDVYSAAVVLYEFIANERFYEGLPEDQIWKVAMKGDHRPRSWRDIDENWRHLLDVALQNDPIKRYGSAKDFRDALLDIADSRGIDLKNIRREASKFMREAFVAEQAQEREMILQATGIAEARTRLFRSPSDLQSELSNLGAMRSNAVELKTEIFDPAHLRGQAAEHLRELQNMMSAFADPNALTELPGDPVRSDESAADIFHLDSSASGRDSSRPPAPRRSSRTSSDTIPPTVAGRRGPRVSDVAAEIRADEQNQISRDALRPSMSRSRPEPLPPLSPKPMQGRHPVLVLCVSLGVVALLGIGVLIAAPWLFKTRASLPANSAVDAGSSAGQILDFVASPVRVDAEEGAGPDGVIPLFPPVDAGFAVMIPLDAKVAEEAAQKVIKKKGTTTLPLVAPRPPARVLKSLKDHVEYLRQYCLTRVACAASVVGSAAAVMSLSTDELRSLRDDAPKCVQRCQR